MTAAAPATREEAAVAAAMLFDVREGLVERDEPHDRGMVLRGSIAAWLAGVRGDLRAAGEIWPDWAIPPYQRPSKRPPGEPRIGYFFRVGRQALLCCA